jgi:hypothetical protein
MNNGWVSKTGFLSEEEREAREICTLAKGGAAMKKHEGAGTRRADEKRCSLSRAAKIVSGRKKEKTKIYEE